MSRHRQQDVRPRYGRIAVLSTSVSVTAIAVLGGVGILPSAAEEPAAGPSVTLTRASEAAPAKSRFPEPAVSGRPGSPGADATDLRLQPSRDTTLPAGSGSGRRVVFSQGRQRVWLVDRGHHVARTYLVSGSVSDNLDPGTYEVYSRSEQAWGIDDSGTMKYFVRFAHGDRAAIGFHDIPVDDGHPVQTAAQLGTPQSHGCIRQQHKDAIALWRFAPLGTTVVVTS
jgi:hypothetical protein